MRREALRDRIRQLRTAHNLLDRVNKLEVTQVLEAPQLGICLLYTSLGRNKTVAKIASERDKPRGLTIVTPGTEHGFLAPLPVRCLLYTSRCV